MSIPTSVRIPDPLAGWLTDRGERFAEPTGVGVQLTRAAGELHSILELELRRLPPLTLAAASLLAEAAGGWLMSTGVGAGMLARDLEDMTRGLEQHYAEHHGINNPDEIAALIDWLQGVGPAADLALRDALSRWWRADNPTASVEGFRAVGLRVA